MPAPRFVTRLRREIVLLELIVASRMRWDKSAGAGYWAILVCRYLYGQQALSKKLPRIEQRGYVRNQTKRMDSKLLERFS
jgi:hypothetical protein